MFSDSSSTETRIQTAKAVLSAAGSLAAAVVVAQTVTNELLPDELRNQLAYSTRSLFSWLSSELTLVIDEFDSIESNHIFDSATLYLDIKTKAEATTTHAASKSAAPKQIWSSTSQSTTTSPSSTTTKHNIVVDKFLELCFNRKHKEKALNRYITYVIEEARRMKEEQKSIKLYTMSEESVWSALNLNHPATFEKIAMDPDEFGVVAGFESRL